MLVHLLKEYHIEKLSVFTVQHICKTSVKHVKLKFDKMEMEHENKSIIIFNILLECYSLITIKLINL